MPVITLTSDWKNSDYYVAVLKGKILCECPDATLIDISHNIQQFSVSQAAYVLKNSFRYFPEGSIHIIAVNAEPTEQSPIVIVTLQGHYFISCDNGIFGLLSSTDPESVVSVGNIKENDQLSPVFTVFSYIACELYKGKKPEDIGEKYDKLFRQIPLLPTIDESVINGSVIYIDSFSNAVTNISEEIFNNVRKNRKFEIYIQSNHYKIIKINKLYSETSIGELLAIFNSEGYLEIALNKGNVADLLNLKIGSVIRIKFN